MDMTALWQEQFTIRSFESDSRGVLKPVALFNLFQDLAGNHARHLGVGYEELKGAGYFWVLSRIKIRFRRMPAWREQVTLTTWPKGADGPFALRDFRMTDRQGGVLLAGASAWLLLDTVRYRPQRLSALGRTFPLRPDDHAIGEPLGKLAVPAGLAVQSEREVLPGDLDVNKHVNNAEYVRWITDCLEGAHAEPPASLQVNYLEEAVRGDTIVLRAGDDPSGVWYCEGIRRGDETRVFQARVELQKKTD